MGNFFIDMTIKRYPEPTKTKPTGLNMTNGHVKAKKRDKACHRPTPQAHKTGAGPSMETCPGQGYP